MIEITVLVFSPQIHCGHLIINKLLISFIYPLTPWPVPACIILAIIKNPNQSHKSREFPFEN